MSALLGFLFAWVAVVRLGEWAFFDHDQDDFVTGIVFAVLAIIAFIIAGNT